jgi:hypothetical protein
MKIEPCPWCHSRAYIPEHLIRQIKHGFVHVRCSQPLCSVQGPIQRTIEKATKAWNVVAIATKDLRMDDSHLLSEIIAEEVSAANRVMKHVAKHGTKRDDVKLTPNGRFIRNKEETKKMKIPYPADEMEMEDFE